MSSGNLKKKKTIIFIINDLSIGGAQQMLLKTIKLYHSRFNLQIITLIDLPGKNIKKEVEKIASVTHINTYRLYSPIAWMNVLVKIRKINPDLMISFLFISNLFTRGVGFILGIPTIAFERNLVSDRSRVEKLTDKLLSLVSHKICAVADAVKRDLIKSEKIPERLIEVVPNAIEIPNKAIGSKKKLKKKLTIPLDHQLIISVTRIVPQKDIFLMLEAFKLLVQNNRKLMLIIVGGGKLTSEVEKRAKKYHIDELLRITGFTDPKPYYQIADLYLNTSKKEGLSNSILEAVSFQIPVVAADVGGNQEIVKDGYNGYIINSRNPSEYAKALDKLLNDQKLLNRMKINSKQVIKDFSLDKYQAKLDLLIKTVLKMPKRIINL